MFYICLIDVKKVPEDDLRNIATCRSFDGLYVKMHIILTYRAFVGITKWIVYKCMDMNNNKTLFYYITAAKHLWNRGYALYLRFVHVCGCVSICINHG
jgi:hypothetical protein